MFVSISPRSAAVLRTLASGEALSRGALEAAIGESRITTLRELARLIEAGYVTTSGEARATTYAITEAGRRIAVWDVEDYLRQEPDQRHARYTHIEPRLFQAPAGMVGQPPVLTAAGAHRLRREADSTTARKELERFVIELSWKSSKIEGNTYTLLDTERLIRDGIPAPGHPHDELVMILNHKRAFDYIWQHRTSFHTLTKQQIEEVHTLLVQDLNVPTGLRTSPVGITGTTYTPPASKAEIASHLDHILDAINSYHGPSSSLDKALGCLVLLPYLQPFADGNKRTSRLIANAVLLAHGYPPLSYRSIDEQAYKAALILFYEQGTLANFRDLFLRQLEDASLNYFFPTGS